MTAAGDARDALERLPADARERLDAFARAIERIHVDDLPLHVARRRQPQHRRAVERAALVARETGLEEVVDAARRALSDGIIREYAAVQVRVGIGMNTTATSGDQALRVLESLSEAVSALVLGDRLDADTRGQLLGLWDRLLP